MIGIGIGQAWHSAGMNGFDGLVRITEDGKLHIHTGVGNLETFSHSVATRVATEVLKINWGNCILVRGDSRKGLPWNSAQTGNNTTFTETRTNCVAAMDAVTKLNGIVALELGVSADDYDIGDEKVFSIKDPFTSIGYADVAKRTIELGGKYSGQEAVGIIAGTGLICVAKDNLEKKGTAPGIVVGFMGIELDTEAGKYEIPGRHSVTDCGTVAHYMGLETKINGGAVHGIGKQHWKRPSTTRRTAYRQIWVYINVKLPGSMGITLQMDWNAVDIADPQNPVGAQKVSRNL